MSYWYISFADDDRFRGATVVMADSAEHALAVATSLDLNPGGQAAILEVPPEIENAPDLLAIRGRLASREEMMALGGKRHGDLPDEVREGFERDSAVVCNECNGPSTDPTNG